MMEASFKEEDTHLVAILRGKWDVPEMTRCIVQIRAKAMQSPQTRILADCRDVSAPATEFHRYLAGVDVARILPRPFKLSVLYLEELVNRFGETVAVNRGADIRVFHEEEQALQWLLADISKTADADDT